MTKLRGNRWTRIHEQGQANFDTQNNVMDIMVGTDRCRAEITYETTMVRTYQKAAYWLLRSLTNANAEAILAMAAEEITAKAAAASREDEEISVNGEGWNLQIEKLDKGVFRAVLNWVTSEESDGQLSLAEAEEKPAPKKKRGRKKKAAVEADASTVSEAIPAMA